MKAAITTMPIKRGGKTLPTNTPLELEADEFNALEKDGIVVADNETSKVEEPTEVDGKLKSRLAELLKGGATFKGLKAPEVKQLLGDGFEDVTMRDFGTALKALKAETQE